MGQIKVTKCPIEGLCIIEPAVHGDDRGYFMETYNQKDMEEAGLTMNYKRRIKRPSLPEAVPPGQTGPGHQRKSL